MWPKLLAASRFWISSGEAPSGAKGTKKWPCNEAAKAGGDMYEATPSRGRWNGGEGRTSHDSPSGIVIRPVSTRNDRAFAVQSA